MNTTYSYFFNINIEKPLSEYEHDKIKNEINDYIQEHGIINCVLGKDYIRISVPICKALQVYDELIVKLIRRVIVAYNEIKSFSIKVKETKKGGENND